MNINTLTAPAVTTLLPYGGEWGYLQASHLLRRATFAPLKSEIEDAIALGLDGTLDQLFATIPLPAPPLYFDYDSHPDVREGETWVNAPLNSTGTGTDQTARRRSTEAWMLLTQSSAGMTIRQKMVFFWINHFGIASDASLRAAYLNYCRYHNDGLGDFRQLIKDMAIEPMMLVFLNGSSSTSTSPNENFAREILELFTIGKGEDIGGGDYTNYTEVDVAELAKVFTGWRARNLNTQTAGLTPEGYFTASRHDTSTKTLSHRFGSAEIVDAGEDEYANAIDIIFEQDEVAHFICRKLYRQFVYYNITPAIEQSVIAPMAQLMLDNDYEIAPSLRALLSSEHFFEMQVAGDVIKNPVEYILSIYRPTRFFEQASFLENYRLALRAHYHADSTGIHQRKPPTVAGWPAYYQSPGYYRLWLNTNTIQLRTNFLRAATISRVRISGVDYYVDWLSILEEFTNPTDPNSMISDMALLLMPQPLDQAQLDGTKELLLPGLEDFVWAGEYANYLSNPFDPAREDSVRSRLNTMMYGMLQLAEFQLH